MFDDYQSGLGKLKADLKRLQDLDSEKMRKEAGQNGGWEHLASPVSSDSKETDE